MARGLELAVAYISLAISGTGLTRDVAAQLSGLDRQAADAGRRAGRALAAGMDSSKPNMAGYRSEVEKSRAVAERAAKEVEAARHRESQATQLVEQRTKELTAATEKYGAGSSQVIAKERQLTDAKFKLSAESQKAEAAQKGLSQAQEKAKGASDNLTAAEKRVGDEAGKTNRSMGELGRTLVTVDFDRVSAAASRVDWNGAQRGAMIFGGAIVGAFGGAVKTAVDFESQMSAVKAVSGATAPELQQLHDKALQLGKDTSFSASEGAVAIEELVKAGVTVPDVMAGAADATVALAAASGIELPDAATIAANAMNSFGLEADKLPGVADRIAGAANASAIDVSDFGQSLSQVGAVANLSGLSFDDTAVAIAELGNAGLKGSDAGTSLKTMLQNLQPSSKAAETAMRQLGIITADGNNRFYDAQGNLKSLGDVQQILQDSTSGLTAAQKQQALQTMFGTDALRAAAIMADNGKGGFDNLATSMGKVTAADTAAARQGNLKGQLEQLTGTLETLGITLGEKLIPKLNDAVQAVGRFIDGFLAMPPGQQELLMGIAAGAAAVALAFAGVIQAVKAYQQIKAVIDLVNAFWFVETAAGKATRASTAAALAKAAAMKVVTAAQWLWNAAMSANPIALIVIAIAALVAGLIYAYQHSETFRRIVDAAWAGIKLAAQAVVAWFLAVAWPAIKTVWDSIASGAVSMGAGISGVWSGIVTAVQGAWAAVTGAFQATLNWVSGVFLAGWGLIQTYLVAPLTAAWTGIVGVWSAISGFLMSWVSWIGAVFATAWGALQIILLLPIRLAQIGIGIAWNAITALFSAAWAWVSGVFMGWWRTLQPYVLAVMTAVQLGIGFAWNWITNRFTAAWTWVATVFMGWWRQLTGLINAVMTAVSNAIGAAWTWITNRFTAAWLWVSVVFMGWWRGLTGLIDFVLIAVRNAVGFAWQWITDRFWAAWNWISGVFMGAWRGLTSMLQGPIDMAKAAIDRILGGIQDAFRFAVDSIRKIWDGIKQAVRAPIVIAIDVANALVGGFNKVADFVKLPLAPTLPPPPGFETGGWTGSVGTRKVAGVVHGKEYVVPADATESIGRPALDYMRKYKRLPGTEPPGFASGGYVWPVPGFKQTRGPHGVDRGIDIAAPMGTPVVAAKSGLVTRSRSMAGSYGEHLITSAGNIYAHLSRRIAQQGQQVMAGQHIGNVGSTGNSTGPHLHFVNSGAGSLIGGIGSSIAGAAENVFGGFATAVDWVKDLTGKALGGLSKINDSPIGKVVGGLPRKASEGLIEKAKSLIPDLGGDPGGAGVDRWRGLVAQTLGMVGLPVNDSYIGAWLRQIQSESGGNPAAIQGIRDVNSGGNEAAGLVQVIPATFARYRSPMLPNDRLNPASSLFAGMNYAKNRYGVNHLGVIGHGHGYWQGTDFARPGLALVGEKGPELINLRGREQIFNANESRKMISMARSPGAGDGGGRVENHVHMDGNFGYDENRVASKITHKLEQAMVAGGIRS